MNGSATDPLDRFYGTVGRMAPGLGGREGIRGHVDALLGYLRIPARLDSDGDWLLHNDAGQFALFARETDRTLVLRQKIMSIDGDPAAYAQDLQVLLMLNLDCEGVCFGMQSGEGDDYMVVLTGQVPWEGLDADRLAGLLAAGFELSADLDDVLSDDEPEPVPVANGNGNGNGAAPWSPDWYPDPRGEARLRYWDGSAWTSHIAP
jgi:hypothetical protein